VPHRAELAVGAVVAVLVLVGDLRGAIGFSSFGVLVYYLLAQLSARHDLPQKLFVIHQFTDDMVDDTQLKPRDELAMVLNADGFGSKPVKVSKYKAFTRAAKTFHQGFKLFYEEDVGLMSPQQVMRLRPKPDLVIYE